MARTAKDQYKVKTGQKTYVCSWTYKTPLESWSQSTLLANIRYGILYAIKRRIDTSVKADELNCDRFKAPIEMMIRFSGGDAEKLAEMNALLKKQGLKSEVQTEFVWAEEDFAVAEEPEETEV